MIRRWRPLNSTTYPTLDVEPCRGAEIVTADYEVLPGVGEILNALEADGGILMGLGTGNIEPGARIKLEPGGLNRYFSFGGFGSASEDRVDVIRDAYQEAVRVAGAAIAPENVFVIGDTTNDVRAGKALGFRTVGVATGHDDEATLCAAKADLVFPDLALGRDQLIRSTRTA